MIHNIKTNIYIVYAYPSSLDFFYLNSQLSTLNCLLMHFRNRLLRLFRRTVIHKTVSLTVSIRSITSNLYMKSYHIFLCPLFSPTFALNTVPKGANKF